MQIIIQIYQWFYSSSIYLVRFSFWTPDLYDCCVQYSCQRIWLVQHWYARGYWIKVLWSQVGNGHSVGYEHLRVISIGAIIFWKAMVPGTFGNREMLSNRFYNYWDDIFTVICTIFFVSEDDHIDFCSSSSFSKIWHCANFHSKLVDFSFGLRCWKEDIMSIITKLSLGDLWYQPLHHQKIERLC